MFYKKIFFLVAVVSFGVLGFFSSADAAEWSTNGKCICKEYSLQGLFQMWQNNGDYPEEIFNSTKAECDQKIKDAQAQSKIIKCDWAPMASSGCFCQNCKIGIGSFNGNVQNYQLNLSKEKCSEKYGIAPVAECTGCKWIEVAPSEGCFCKMSVTILGKTTSVDMFNLFVNKKEDCLSTTKSENKLLEFTNCRWKTLPKAQEASSGSTDSGSSSDEVGLGGSTAITSGSVAPIVPNTVVSLKNPLGEGRTDINAILGDIVKAALGILGSITFLVFVFGGFTWLIAAGNPEKIKKGTQTMVWAVIGLFIIFGSYGILSLVLKGLGTQNQPAVYVTQTIKDSAESDKETTEEKSENTTKEEKTDPCLGKKGKVSGCDTCTATKGEGWACRDLQTEGCSLVKGERETGLCQDPNQIEQEKLGGTSIICCKAVDCTKVTLKSDCEEKTVATCEWNEQEEKCEVSKDTE